MTGPAASCSGISACGPPKTGIGTGRFAVRRRFEAPPCRKRVQNQDAALYPQEAFDDSLGGERLAPAFLPENGDVGVKRGIGDGVRFLSGYGHVKASGLALSNLISLMICPSISL